ncbi:neuronal acetylcholine receptor subunit alpha-2-like [Ptychodera flava]|uniref:neuronal acetylcholine receptor subunit alpha-2-like n=1 Tax=Ptychodera flava TaxID=63121 RepID=UPI00396A7EB9
MKLSFMIQAVFAVILILDASHVVSSSMMTKLFNDILKHYDKRVIPPGRNETSEVITTMATDTNTTDNGTVVTNATDSPTPVPAMVQVSLGMSLVLLDKVDIKGKKLTATAWLKEQWVDERLSWDPSKYGDIEKVRIDSSDIWLPDIVPYGGRSTKAFQGESVKALLYSDGLVYYIPPYEIEVPCEFDNHYFPYDEQICVIKYGSWTYDGSLLDLTTNSDTIDIADYKPNSEWSISDTVATRNVVKYPCCDEVYTDITFSIFLKRNSSLYTASLVVPSILLSLSLLFVFALPPKSREKMTLAIAVLLGLLLLNYAHYTIVGLPTIFGNFLLFVVILALAVIGETVVVYNVFHRNGSVPAILSKLFINCLSRVVCVSTSTSGKYNVEMKEKEEGVYKEGSPRGDAEDWAIIAKVIDRLSFWISLIVYIIVTCVLLASRP